MFCAGCGTPIQSGLNYCSRCGRRVAEDLKARGNIWSNPMTIAGQTAGVGFVAYIFVLLILTKNGSPPNIFLPLTFFYFAALFGICFMFLRQGSLSSAINASTSDDLTESAYLRPVTTAQLPEGFETPGTVTDHTTRTLDPVRRDER